MDAISIDDDARLTAVRQTGLLDHPPQAAFDRLTRLAVRLIGVPVALITLVDADRQFFVSHSGLAEPWASAREMPLARSFCKRMVESGAPLIVDDARIDDRFKGNLAIQALNVVGYAAVPLSTPAGQVLGAFCAVDHQPRAWSRDDLAALGDLAAIAMSEIARHSDLVRHQEAEAHQRMLMSEIDHRVKNSLAVTRSLLEMQARASDDAFVREQLEEAAARVSTIALVHDRLYGHEATGMVNLDDYLRRLCGDLAISFGLDPVPQLLDLDVVPVTVAVDRVVSLGLIVTQLVTTAIRHRTRTVAVGFTADGEGHYLLSVTDAAAALSGEDAGRSTGLGTRLMTALTRQFDGEVSAAEDGTVHIRLPIAALA